MRNIELRLKLRLEISDANYELASKIAVLFSERFGDYFTPEDVIHTACNLKPSYLLEDFEVVKDFNEFLEHHLLLARYGF